MIAQAWNDDANRKRASRAAARDLAIPLIKDPARRSACEADIFTFLATYFPETFYGPWTDQRRKMVEAILAAARYGGDQALAAPRGEGKTTLAECVALYCVLLGLLRFPLICAATGPDAERILDHLKAHLERNDTLAEDFPEVCFPIQALEGAPQRAGSQTVYGERTFLEWRRDCVVLPIVTPADWPAEDRKRFLTHDGCSRASGAVLYTRGLDASIRGIRKGYLRPDLVIIDDPETRESVDSEKQTETRELTIEEDLKGLGGSGRKLARVMLTTLMRRNCLSARYTDPQQKPSWDGKRFKLIEKWPDHADLWDEYATIRNADQQSGDKHSRKAHQFYLDNRAEMDSGALLANPDRFVGDTLPDGTQIEASALQACYNLIADSGLDHFLTEFQNDPPEESGPQESGITAHRIQRQVSGYPRKIIPPDCVRLTMGVDCKKSGLHWVVRAWREDGTGFTIDYGFTETHGTKKGSEEGLDLALTRALQTRRDELADDPYATEDGQAMPISTVLVDAGWRTETIYKFCREAGLSWKPAMGFGKSGGCAQPNFRAPVRSSPDKRVGDHWFLSRQPKGIWLVCDDADHWKAWEHDHWMREPDKPGCLLIYGSEGTPDRMSDDEKGHMSYAKHLTAEIEVEEPVKGVLKRYWKAKSDTNHYFDASRMATVAASMTGVPLLGAAKKGRGVDPANRPSATELAAGR